MFLERNIHDVKSLAQILGDLSGIIFTRIRMEKSFVPLYDGLGPPETIGRKHRRGNALLRGFPEMKALRVCPVPQKFNRTAWVAASDAQRGSACPGIQA